MNIVFISTGNEQYIIYDVVAVVYTANCINIHKEDGSIKGFNTDKIIKFNIM